MSKMYRNFDFYCKGQSCYEAPMLIDFCVELEAGFQGSGGFDVDAPGFNGGEDNPENEL